MDSVTDLDCTIDWNNTRCRIIQNWWSLDFGSIYNFKDNTILPPSLNPSHQGREAVLLPLDGGGRVGVKYNR